MAPGDGWPRLVAVLFTDVASSTSLLAEPDGPATLETHLRVLADAVAANGGEEVKNLGDGVMAVFPGASAALAAALDVQREMGGLNAARRRQGRREWLVRIGVHAGEARSRDDDWFGMTVVVARRLCDQAAGGQIFTSQATATMADALEGLAVDDLGLLALKGVPQLVASVAVVHAAAPLDADRLGLATSSAVPFVGRAGERARLEAAWRSVLDGQSRLVALSGEPGAGKTRLALEVAGLAHAEGAWVTAGSSRAAGGLPYEPIASAFRVLEHDPAALATFEAMPSAGTLASLVPALRGEGWSAPVDGSETDRQLLFDAVVDAVRHVTAARPLVVILDDLHWADTPSIRLLQHVVQHCQDVPLLTVVTYRSTDIAPDHPLLAVLEAIRRTTALVEVGVRELAEDDVQRMLASTTGEDGPHLADLAAAIHAETGGNALFAEALCLHVRDHLAALADAGRRALADALPSSVLATVRNRLARLSEPAQALLRIGAVQGSTFDLDVTERTGQVEGIEDALDAAIAAGLLRETGRESEVGFPHEVVRHAVYSELTDLRRRRLHRLVADALEASPRPPAPAAVAGHLAAAGSAVEPQRLLDWTSRAARAAVAALAFEDAVGHAERAVTTSADLGPAERLDALLLLGDACFRAGEVVAGQQRYVEAADVARSLDRPAAALGLCRAAFGIAGFEAGLVMRGYGIDNQDVVRLLDEAGTVLDRLPDDPELATMTTVLRSTMHARDPAPAGQRIVEDLANEARRREDWRALTFMLLVRGGFRFTASPTAAHLGLIDDLVAGAAKADLADVELWARAIRVDHLLIVGDVDAADEEREVHRALALRRRGVHHQVTDAVIDATRAIQRAEYAKAEIAIQAAFDLGTSVGYGASLVIYGAQLVGMAFERTGAVELRSLIESILAMQDIPEWFAMLAHIHAEEGRPDEARALVDRIAAEGFDGFVGARMLIGPSILVDLACLLDDHRHLDALEAQLLPGAGQQILIGTAVLYGGPVDRALARIDALRGDVERADVRFTAAAAQCARQGARGWHGMTCQQHADVLLRAGGDEYAERASALLAEADALAAVTGNPRLAAAVTRTRALQG